MKAPFPYFGGKSRIAKLVWGLLGDVKNYVEPFAGSLAVLLARPGGATGTETVNDLDGYIANFWRAVSGAPDEVAAYADWPVNESDLHARHIWLLGRRDDVVDRLVSDPDWYDAKVAGWWVWGISAWIGSGWCSGKGVWTSDGSRLVRSGGGVTRARSLLPQQARWCWRQIPHLSDKGKGIHCQRRHGDVSFNALGARLCNIRVCTGDWSRVTSASVTWRHGLTGVFLDPPYGHAGADWDRVEVYAKETDVVTEVEAWCLEAGARPDMRVVLAGYGDEYDLPGWARYPWKAKGGYNADRSGNSSREMIWASPACRKWKRLDTAWK